ncbi:hypothetical protein IBX65_02115, partial [Candidatus Aerophobetes bacterium]|nr:hypothetical protein [Candidatus Aerophobetes bacterium]
NEQAVELARALQEKNILVFMASSSNGKSMAEQLAEEGIEMNWDTFLVPYGKDTSAAVLALNFAARSAMTFGGIKPGDFEAARKILLYNKDRVHAFVLALGADPEVNGTGQLITDEKYATAAGAINFGFPCLSDINIPQILPTGICTYEHVVSGISLDKIVTKAVEVRGLEIKVTEIPIPVPYGAGFEGERVRKEQMQVEFGGKKSIAFELLRGRSMDQVEDGKIEVIGPDVDEMEEGAAYNLGTLVQVAGRQFSEDFETVLERRIHEFISCANGIFHMGQRAIAWIRISKEAYQKGFRLKHLGEILVAKIKDEYSKIVDKVQVKLITDEEKIKELLEAARKIYHERDERLGGMTDEDVDEFFSCILCVPGEETILLPDGSFKSVENLFDEASFKYVLSLNSHDFQAQSVEELFLNPAPSKLIKITLSNGNSLALTPNHNLLVDKKEALEWLRASELKIGDWLMSPLTSAIDKGRDKEPYVIDFLSPEIKVCDDEALFSLKGSILRKYETLSKGASKLGIDYQKLYQALRIGEKVARRRLSLKEVKSICEKLTISWNEFKTRIKELGIGKGCRLNENILNEEFLYVAGLVASDGCIIKRGKSSYVQFTNAEKTLVDRFGQIVCNWLGVHPKVYEVEPAVSISKGVEVRGRQKVFVCHVHNPLLGQILMGLGVRKNRGWNGESISSLSSSLVASFIRGLFDGDGHVTKEHIFISTGDYKEAQHIHLLLKKLGISSYITKTTRGYQIGTRSFNDVEKFRALISSQHPAKLQKMEEVLSHRDKNHVIRTDTVPYLCGRLIENLVQKYQKKLQITKLSVDYKTIKNWIAGKHRISREKLKLLLDDLKEIVEPCDYNYRELLSWYNSRASFERIKDIQEVKYLDSRVYNFSVKNTHNYLVNGVVVKNCQSYAPNHVCIVTPERLGLCGAYTTLDCKASYQINPHGPNEPVKKGKCLDPVKGQWEGINEYLKVKSNGNLEKFNAYSMLEDPMTSCGCFECIVALLPEANGVMIVNREFSGMTPVGMTFSTMAGQVGGGVQTPGFIGIGKLYITSKKFISAEGGLKRVVWMPDMLKEEIKERLQKRLEEIGEPDLMEKIASEKDATTTEELLEFLQKKNHPALSMEPMM